MKVCSNCGGEVSEQAIYCRYCGIQLLPLPPEIAALKRTEEERLRPLEVNSFISIDTELIKKAKERLEGEKK